MMIVTISGSLRSNSTNTALLGEIIKLVPHETMLGYDGLAGLPAFNPDLAEQQETLPTEVLELYRQVEKAEGLIIACPEYASEILGTLKNLFDWLVSTTLLEKLPVLLITSSSSGSGKVQAAMNRVLQMVDADLYAGPDFQAGYLTHVKTYHGFGSEVTDQLRVALQLFGEAIATNRIQALGYCA